MWVRNFSFRNFESWCSRNFCNSPKVVTERAKFLLWTHLSVGTPALRLPSFIFRLFLKISFCQIKNYSATACAPLELKFACFGVKIVLEHSLRVELMDRTKASPYVPATCGRLALCLRSLPRVHMLWVFSRPFYAIYAIFTIVPTYSCTFVGSNLSLNFVFTLVSFAHILICSSSFSISIITCSFENLNLTNIVTCLSYRDYNCYQFYDILAIIAFLCSPLKHRLLTDLCQ